MKRQQKPRMILKFLLWAGCTALVDCHFLIFSCCTLPSEKKRKNTHGSALLHHKKVVAAQDDLIFYLEPQLIVIIFCTTRNAYDLQWCQKTQAHRWHLHPWSWGKKFNLQHKIAGWGETSLPAWEINTVNTLVDCYFDFFLIVLVGDLIDTCEPQEFTLWHHPVAAVVCPDVFLLLHCPAMLILLHCPVTTVVSPVAAVVLPYYCLIMAAMAVASTQVDCLLAECADANARLLVGFSPWWQ